MAIVREGFFDGAGSAQSQAVTVTSTAAGNTLLALVRWYHATATLSSVTVAGESNATLLGSPQTGAPDSGRTQWAILSNVTGSGSKAVTANLSAVPTAIGISVWRLSGCLTSGANDVIAGATGTSTNPTVNLTTTVGGAGIFAGFINNNGELSAPGTGYTEETVANAQWYDSAQYDLDVGASGSKTVNATLGGSGDWLINAISIKPDANAAPTFPGPSISVPTLTQGGAMASIDVTSSFLDSGDTLTYSAIGSWPTGVTVSSAGVISGTPTVSGTYGSLSVRATDTAAQTVDSNTFTITISSIRRPSSDVTTTGWTTSTGGSFYALIDETSFDDADYIISPAVTASTDPITLGLSGTLAAGTYTLRVRAKTSTGTARFRIILLNSSSVQQGVTAYQTIDSTFQTYSLAATTTGDATRARIEVVVV